MIKTGNTQNIDVITVVFCLKTHMSIISKNTSIYE